MSSGFSIAAARRHFPALRLRGSSQPHTWLDYPAGTQEPQVDKGRMADCFSRCNADPGGHFRTARQPDEAIEVRALGVDFALSSPFMQHGPHMSVSWGRKNMPRASRSCKVCASGLLDRRGVLRVGLAHCNTGAEADGFQASLKSFVQ